MGNNKSLISQTTKPNITTMTEATNFIPSIKVTYAISDHFAQGKAKLGDFFLDDQSLGAEIKATALGYRYQAIALEKEGANFVESLVLGESETPFRDRKEYKSFIEKNNQHDIQDGIDILLYLPDHGLFGVLFTKKKLAKGGLQILENAGGGHVVSIKTIKKEWKKFTWFELEVNPTGEKIKIEHSEEKIEIYKNQIIETIKEDVKKNERAR